MARKLLITIILCFAVMSSAYPDQRESTASEILLDRVHNALSTIRSLETDFIQTRHLFIFEDELVSEGKLYYAMPDQMRWEITKPYRSALIFNRNQVGKFQLAGGKLRKMELAGAALFSEIMGQMIYMMKGDFSTIKNDYILTASENEHVTVTLIPRSKNLASILNSLTFTMDPKTMRVKQLKLQEGSEDDIVIVFQNEKENHNLNPNLFSTTTPSGFEPEISE